MSAQPPLGGNAPPLQCNQLMNGDFAAPIHCGKPATWHIIWDSSVENGLCCDKHMDEARAKWVFYASHPYRVECSMPGAVYVHAENVCVIDEDWFGLEELAVAAEVSP